MMPTFEFTSPEGKTYEVTGPEGSTKEEAFAKLQQQLSASGASPAPTTSTTPVAAPNANAPPQRSGLAQVGRSVGLAARNFAQAAGGGVGMVGDALNAGINLALPKNAQLRSPSKIIQAGIDKVLPVPETTGEKVQDFVGTIAASGVRGGVDPLMRALTSRLPAPIARVPALNERAKTLAAAKPLGFVATPSTMHSGPISKTVEFAAGKTQLNAAAAEKNQVAYDALARRVAGLPSTTPLTHDNLQQVIKSTYQAGYEPIEQLGRITNGRVYRQALNKALSDFQGASRSFPTAVRDDVRQLINNYRVSEFDAADGIKATQVLRESASDAFRAGNSQLGKANMAVSDAIEKSIELNLAARGQPELLAEFKNARKLLAQQYTIRNAIKEGTGSIDPLKLRSGLNAGKPFPGELKVAAKFANTFPQISGIEKAAGGNNWTDRITFGIAAPLAAVIGGPAAAGATAAAPFVRQGTRAAMLTGPGQAMVTPSGLDPNILAQFLRRKSVINAMPTTMQQSGLYSPED